ncbi:RecB family exonuclease [Undibacterium crateris]|uniref:RecB family exonuclease n=1 Tax=Undibacterium crateris TaxID=2528175 RepID=UPI001389A0B9|nr:PD-(D/E)XK nuclease family protein [Undibacterium crateris]NDI85120.1 PD-(D/E)XK nuclease family protein [Undibacterium crateris]
MKTIGTIRASSCIGLFDCALSWYYTNIKGIRSPSNGLSATGTAIHAGTAYFDEARMNGETPEVSAAVEITIDALNNPNEEVQWDSVKMHREMELKAIKLTTRYCIEIAPTREYVAVELHCPPLNVQTKYGVIKLTGSTDRIRRTEDRRLGISDLKSGKMAVKVGFEDHEEAVASTANHHIQLGIYTLLAEEAAQTVFDAPAEIIGLSTGRNATIAISEVEDVKTALLGTDEVDGMLDMAGKMLKEGFFPPNPRSILCSKKYCAGYSRCPYKGK